MDHEHRPDPGGSGREREGGVTGVPSRGANDRTTYSPTGGPGMRHWQEARVTRAGLGDRDDVFFAAVEMTRMPMILTDPNLPDNPIVFSNRAFSDLTGYEQSEIVGRNCRFLQGPRTDDRGVSELRESIAERKAISVEILNYKRDGTPFWNAVFVAPVYGPDDKLLYFFASQLDVTRRKASETAMHQSQKMESIGQLTAGLAHDFNNLLQVVTGNIELMRAKVQDPRLLRYLEAAGSAAERGSRLTKQLLAFARKTRLDPRPVDLTSLVNEFGDMLDSTAGTRVDLRFDLRRRLPRTLVDPIHLEMALLNVVINARDAMPAGGTVTVATSVTRIEEEQVPGGPAPGEYVCLAVTDEGTGMPPHVAQRATEPFFTTKGTGKGTGLGLAMVQGFVQQSLGRLEIDTHEGRGTSVRMLFPVAVPETDFETPPPREAELPAEPPPAARRDNLDDAPRGNGETVLLVEDSDDVIRLAREHLTSLGYRVVEARDADEAMAALADMESRGTLPDLLFTDLIMPGSMNGLALAETVKRRLPGLPVLLTTGYNEQLVAQGPAASGMDLIGKPYRRRDLADRVKAALDRHPPAAPPRTHEGPAHAG